MSDVVLRCLTSFNYVNYPKLQCNKLPCAYQLHARRSIGGCMQQELKILGFLLLEMSRANLQRRLNERPEHVLHDHLYPLVEVLKTFNGAFLQAAIPWTPVVYQQVIFHFLRCRLFKSRPYNMHAIGKTCLALLLEIETWLSEWLTLALRVAQSGKYGSQSGRLSKVSPSHSISGVACCPVQDASRQFVGAGPGIGSADMCSAYCTVAKLQSKRRTSALCCRQCPSWSGVLPCGACFTALTGAAHLLYRPTGASSRRMFLSLPGSGCRRPSRGSLQPSWNLEGS